MRWLKKRADDLELVSIRVTGLLPFHVLRVAILRLWGAKVDKSVTIYHGVQVRCARRLVIGPHTIIGDDAILDARGGLTIGANVNFSSEVRVWTAQHDWRSADFGFVAEPVVIGDWAWLSAGTTVLPGVSVGRGAVVAAGAVASNDVDELAVVGGVPAKRIAQRPESALGYVLGHPRLKKWWW